MKRTHHLLLVVVLPCAGFAVAWALGRAGQESASVPVASPAAPVPQRAERRPLTAAPPAAAPHPLERGAATHPAESHHVWVELNNEATTDLAAGDLARAVEKLARCLAAEPENPVFAGNLAEALVRLARLEQERGQLESALEHLAQALEVGTAREDLAVLRGIHERWQRELELGQNDWTEGSSRFELSYDTDRSDILHRSHEILEHLELSYDELVRWFGADPLAGEPSIRVVLYEPADFDRLTGLGDWAAGVFDGVVRVSVRDLTAGSSWRAVLVHELVHAFVQAVGGPRVPGWLNEGLAQMLEGHPGEVARLREGLRGQELFTLEALGGSLAGWQDRAAIARAYAQSLVFVDYLRATHGEEVLRRMLRGIPAGISPAQAFEGFTQVSLELVFQDWQASLRR